MAAMLRDGKKPYIRFSSVLHHHPELMEEVDETWLIARRRASRGAGTFGMFLGAEGTGTGLHAAMAPNLFVQVHGQRRWTIFPADFGPIFMPSVEASPFFVSHVDAQAEYQGIGGGGVPRYEAVLEPGDVLFNPAFYWHQVTNLSHSLGLGYRWTSLQQAWRTSKLQTLITMTATNPSVLGLRKQDDLATLVDGRRGVRGS